MPSKTERTALMFLAGVVLAGGLVRVVRAIGRGQPPPPAATAALARQRAVVDSVAAARSRSRGAGPGAARGDAGGRRGATGRGGARSAARGTGARAAAPPAPSPFPVNVNRASVEELTALPRIGPAIAQRIVAERAANGPFAGLAALDTRVKGIGPAMIHAIAPLVIFSPP